VKPATAWPLAIVAVLAVTVAANVVLLVQASAPGATQVEPDYYRRALAWDSTQAERARSAALGWRAEAAFGKPGAGGTPLSLTLRDASGRAVTGARLELAAVHNLERGGPTRWLLAEEAPGAYGTLVRSARAGRWELRLTATREAERYVCVLHAEAPPAAAP